MNYFSSQDLRPPHAAGTIARETPRGAPGEDSGEDSGKGPGKGPGKADAQGELVLLFYDGYERSAHANPARRLKANLRARLRAAYRSARGMQVNTGFYAAFLNLVGALRAGGYDVRINDFGLARRFPTYPVGIAGYPSVLEGVSGLANPMLFGPGDPGFPDRAREVLDQTNVRAIIQPSDWFVEHYRTTCGDRVVRWPVGLDTERLGDQRTAPKSVDVLIYDKIRWHHDAVYAAVVARLEAHLRARGLSYEIVRYGSHTYPSFLEKLRRSRSFAFICEHETQGLACQEAMSMNVPVFAWDEGELVDPQQIPFLPPGLAVSSVPYFDARCGIRFRRADIEARFDTFWSRVATYRPRDYVLETLTLASSAEAYVDILGRLGPLHPLADLRRGA
ncbi:glycosyltransferase [Methylobacterium sp. A54F]